MKDRGITPRPAQTGVSRQISIVSNNTAPKTRVPRQISVVSNSALPPPDYDDDVLPPPSPPPSLPPHDYDDPGINKINQPLNTRVMLHSTSLCDSEISLNMKFVVSVMVSAIW